MHPLNLVLLLATTPGAAPPPEPLTIDMPSQADAADPVMRCVASRLTPFMSPYGIRQTWPVMASPPPEFLHTLGTPLSDSGLIADGYVQYLHIDRLAQAIHVVEQGGFAGTTKVYGPLPLPRCTPAPAAPASIAIPPR